ncbi:MAG: arginase family protein [Bacteriovoracaceae bacterium]|nr:arginase family protein [Bacteriovoracaceae bacterium]
MLCPPGNGVFTVNTAKERKELLHSKLFENSDNPSDEWLKCFDNIQNWNKTHLLGVCSDTGGGILRGANWGPLFVRLELLKELKHKNDFIDLGDIRVIPHLLHDKYLNESTLSSCKKALYGDKDSPHPVSPLSLVEYFLDHLYSIKSESNVFAIGGDHSVSYPLVKSWLKNKNKNNIKTALLHFDAHTDLLVERLGIDLCFGSWVTHILDDLPSPSLCHQVGIRSSGKDKSHWEKTFGVHQYWTKEVKSKGPTAIAETIIQKMKAEGTEEIYVSFDIDAIDSNYASATGTPEPNGLEPHEAIVILELVCKEFKVTGADMVEVSPFLDTGNTKGREPDTTLETSALISSLLIREMNKNGDN